MSENTDKALHRERTRLLDRWPEASGQEKLKILVRLMDIDDDLTVRHNPVTRQFTRTRRQKAFRPAKQKKTIS